MASDRKHMSECIQVFQYNSNPAPSKLYGKVMNLLLKRGKVRTSLRALTHKHTQTHTQTHDDRYYFAHTHAIHFMR
jgi:hypothetical protein